MWVLITQCETTLTRCRGTRLEGMVIRIFHLMRSCKITYCVTLWNFIDRERFPEPSRKKTPVMRCVFLCVCTKVLGSRLKRIQDAGGPLRVIFNEVITVIAHYVARYHTQFGVDLGSHTWLHSITQIILQRSKSGRKPGKTNKFV
jgi:hypothetical protein